MLIAVYVALHLYESALMYGVRLIANAICMWIQHLIYQLSAQFFRSTATRTSSIGDVFKTLALLQPIFSSIELDALLLADIFDGDIFRPMINSMKKAGFSDSISIRGFFGLWWWSRWCHG